LNKKIILCVVILFLLLCSISGCIDTKSADYKSNERSQAGSPVAVIVAPNKAYFGETIEFDASNSYDTDGKIVQYYWNFMDGNIKNGRDVKHVFEFNNDFRTKYPLIYTVSLFVVDNNQNIKPTIHQIKLYPKSYILYFKTGKITGIKPTSHSESFNSQNALILNSQREVVYELEEPISIPDSTWDLALNLEKPFFSIVSKISVTFYDINNKKIGNAEEKLGLDTFWRQKIIYIKGNFEKDVELKSVKISASCFPKFTDIKIFYGSETASKLTFLLDESQFD